MSEAVVKGQLQERTRQRNRSIWVALDWGGLLDPLGDQQAILDSLGSAGLENHLAVTDEEFETKEYQRDRVSELEQATVDQDRQIAEAKAATGRAKLAIQRTADEYVLAAKVYDVKVKGLIMGAKEYAARVELEQLEVEKSQVDLAIAKEGLHLKQVNAQIYYEAIQQAQVEVDLARAQVDVAKAHVRAVMADIEAGKADIEVIEAEVQQYVAAADKATLQADVAQIFAEILTKRLSAIRLDIGQKEIEAGFGYIQSRLEDLLALWDTRQATETILTKGETEYQGEIALTLAANKAEQDLKVDEIDKSLETFDYEKGQTEATIGKEQALQDALTNVRLHLLDARLRSTVDRDNQDTWGQETVYAAQAAASAHRSVTRTSNSADFTTMTIE